MCISVQELGGMGFLVTVELPSKLTFTQFTQFLLLVDIEFSWDRDGASRNVREILGGESRLLASWAFKHPVD